MSTKKEILNSVLSSIKAMSAEEYKQLLDSVEDKESIRVITGDYAIALSHGHSVVTNVLDYNLQPSHNPIILDSIVHETSLNINFPSAALAA